MCDLFLIFFLSFLLRKDITKQMDSNYHTSKLKHAKKWARRKARNKNKKQTSGAEKEQQQQEARAKLNLNLRSLSLSPLWRGAVTACDTSRERESKRSRARLKWEIVSERVSNEKGLRVWVCESESARGWRAATLGESEKIVEIYLRIVCLATSGQEKML